MHQTKILASSEGVSTRWCDGGLGSHPRMAHQVRAGECREVVPRSHLGWRTGVLVEVDGLPYRQHVVARVVGPQPGAHCFRRSRGLQHRVVGAHLHCAASPQLTRGRRLELRPWRTGSTAVDAELAPTVWHSRCEHRHTSRLRTALCHANQDRHHQGTQLLTQFGVLNQ